MTAAQGEFSAMGPKPNEADKEIVSETKVHLNTDWAFDDTKEWLVFTVFSLSR